MPGRRGKLAQVSSANPAQPGFLFRTDRMEARGKCLSPPQPNFDKYEYFPFFGNDVDFVPFVAPVSTHHAQSSGLQKPRRLRLPESTDLTCRSTPG